MWFVRLALRRPYTFVVAAILILILGVMSVLRTPRDIFPDIDIPVVSVLWNYSGLSAQEMSERIVSQNERAMTTTVNDIEHIESQTWVGRAIVKVFFQPGTDIGTALSQVTAICQTQLRFFPPGTTPPLVIEYSASSVPILQIGLGGRGLTEQRLFDLGVNFIRTQLATVQGAAVPYPYGGKIREVLVDLNTAALQAKGLSPVDVVNAVGNQDLILPSGTAKIGPFEYDVESNGSPETVQALNNLPIKTAGNTVIYIHDVAHVRDGFPPQTNIVHVDGQRSVLLTVLKTGKASTLDIIERVKQVVRELAPTLPPQLKVSFLADQSLFVRAAIQGVLREALIAACLTAAMILVFLGSWRSTLIIAVSIPLSILTSLILLSALGETVNIMTLGGMALAVGILVDDATVAIENISRNLGLGKDLEPAILDGSREIAVPAFVSTLSICIVFVPVFFLSGVAHYLFVPLAEAVVFAMLASYALSRTLVVTMAKYLLKGHEHDPEKLESEARRHFLARAQLAFERGFEAFRIRYCGALSACMGRRGIFAIGFLAAGLASFLLLPWLGQDFFPNVDTGQFTLHMRARTGTRIEETARICALVETFVRRQLPAREITSTIDNIGLPNSSINLSYSNSAPIGTGDAEILVSLAPGHRPTAAYVKELRPKLARAFPGVTFYFLPSDIVSQILNFGLPAPVNVQVVGSNVEANREFADRLLDQMKRIPGAADLRIQQAFNLPELYINVDRTRAQQVGFTARDVASDMLISLTGSFQTSPAFWLDPKNGVTYSVQTQSPEYEMNSLQDLRSVPLSGGVGAPPQILGNLASIGLGGSAALVSHYNVAPVIDIFGSVEGRDLGGVAGDLDKVVQKSESDLPRGSRIVVRGQVQTMRSSFRGLIGGLIFSIVLVYLLIVVNFQSWLDPLIIISALPAALAGIVWMLFVTDTTVSVPALTGAIMCMGVATANSILVVSFAKEKLAEGSSPVQAALQAAYTRFRPVLMTALAMIMGMVPMALSLGEGGEQNAPLGRAVIGGLLFATISTLLFVPVVFAIFHGFRHSRDGRNSPSPAEY